MMETSLKISMPFRTARIGTMKAYKTAPALPMKLNTKRLKFSVKLRPDTSTEVIEVYIPAKEITGVKSFLGRGCPVVWIQTSDECSKNIQSLLGMKKGPIPSAFYDPKSKLLEETHIGLVIDLDPIPYTDSYRFKQVVQEIFEQRGLSSDNHLLVSHSVCNSMLVAISQLCDKLASFQKKATAATNQGTRINVHESLKLSSSVQSETEARTQPPAVPKPVETPVVRRPIQTAATPAIKPRISPKAIGSPPSRNVNRARKSVPKSSMSVSLESQLDEIRAKAGKNSKEVQIINVNDMKNMSSPISPPAPSTGHKDTESDDAGSSGSRKKRPKDPLSQIWGKGKTKKRVKRPPTEGDVSSQPSGTPSPKVGQTLNTPFSTVSASLTPGSPTSTPKPQDPEPKESSKTLVQMAGQSITISKCKCVEKNPHMVITGIEPLKCMALDCVDGRLSKCIGVVQVPMMMTPSDHSPLLALCEEHRERMLRHECCPGCGMFCAGGTYFICVETPDCPHRFHKDCMLLYRQTKNCLHCCGPMSKVREVVVEPRQDYRLRWMVGGMDPNKMEKKRVLNGRIKSARMGHKSSATITHYDNEGVIKSLRPGLVIDTTNLPKGRHRDLLEEELCSFFEESHEKLKIHPKNIPQVVQQGDLKKLIHVLHEAEDQDVRNLLKNPSVMTKTVMTGKTAMVFLLQLAGAKLNGKDTKGKTPLFYAEEREDVDIMNFLIKSGADFRLKDNEGMTCMHQAAKNGRIVSCATLLAYGPDIVNMPDEGGWTPIVWSTEHKHTTTAKYLEHFGADVMKKDKEGNTCLHWAALSGNLDLLITCLQKRTSVDTKNELGDTALHIAARQDHYNCVLSLTNWGADCEIRNNAGNTPLESAMADTNSFLLLKFKQKVKEAMSKPSQSSFVKDRTLSTDLSKGFEELPVSCVNSVDNAPSPAGSPDGFHYVTTNVHTSSETIVKNPTNKMQSCYCYIECNDGHCLCGVLSGRCWYDKNGQLVPEFDFVDAPYIVECSETCWCPATCHNRVVQKGIRYNLQVHRTRAMGWSVRTLDTIPRGAFVCEYVGELISDAEADVREDDSYLFDLENSDGEIFCIDARYYGNVSRFINHLCDPNLMPLRVFIDHHDKRFPRLAYFSTKEIKAGEELGFDYGDRFWDVKCRSFTCGCGSPRCKYSEEAYRLRREQEKEAAGNGSSS